MDVNEILERINQYFPIAPEQYIKDYIEKLQNTILNCYEKEEYQMAYFNTYLLFMTYIYIVIYQISMLKSKEYSLVSEYIRAYNGKNKDLNNIENIFEYSEIPDKEILKLLAIIDIDKATIGKYKGATENRDPMAHATGYYVINTLEEFEIKTRHTIGLF